MLTVSNLASIDYYAKTAELDEEPSEFGIVKAGAKRSEGVGYYDERQKSDPLARPGVYMGRQAERFGFAGRPVDHKSFTALYHGLDPNTGEPLSPNIPTLKEQRDAQKSLESAEERHEKTRRRVERVEREIERKGASPALAQKLTRAKAAERDASKARDEAKKANARNPGRDLQFALPKEFSMLHAALILEGQADKARQIEEAGLRAVERTLKEIESEYIKHRPRSGKHERDILAIDGLSAAVFTHLESRKVGDDGAATADPQVHFHAAVFAPTDGLDGDVQAGWFNFLASSESQKAVGAGFRARATAEINGLLKSWGHDVEFAPDFGLDGKKNVVAVGFGGVGVEGREQFSKRRAQIRENVEKGLSRDVASKAGRGGKSDGETFYDELGERYADAGISSETLLRNRERERVKEEVERGMRIARENEGTGPAPGTPAFDERVERETERRLEAARDAVPNTPEAIVKALIEKDVVFSAESLKRYAREAAQFSGARTMDEADAYARELFERCMTHEDLLELSADRESNGKDKVDPTVFGALFTSRTRRAEETKLYFETIPALARARDFKTLDRGFLESYIEKAEDAQGWRLSDGQRSVVFDILSSPSRIAVTTAFAGSGKTAVARLITDLYKSAGKPCRVLAIAPSNKAAEGLASETGMDQFYSPERLMLEIEGGKLALTNSDVLYVDEASLLDFSESKALLDAAAAAGAKVVLSGDERQIKSVQSGRFLQRTVSVLDEEQKRDPSGPRLLTRMTEGFAGASQIRRQSQVWDRKTVALAELGYVVEALDQHAARGRLERKADARGALDAAASAYSKEAGGRGGLPAALAACAEAERSGDAARIDQARAELSVARRAHNSFFERALMVAGTNADVCALNASAREELKKAGLIASDDFLVPRGRKAPLRVAVGEKMMLTATLGHKHATFEGGGRRRMASSSAFVVESVEQRAGSAPILSVVFDSGERARIDTRDFSSFSHGYAMTFAKAQGQTRDKVFAVFTGAAGLSAENALIAASRHKQDFRLFVVAHEEQSIRRSAALSTEKKEAVDQHLMSALSKDERESYLARRAELEEIKRKAEAPAEEIARRTDELHETSTRRRTAAAFVEPYVGLLSRARDKARELVERIRPPVPDPALKAHADLLARAFPDVARGATLGLVARDDARALTARAAAERNWLCADETRLYCENAVTGRIEAWDREAVERVAPPCAALAASRGDLVSLASAVSAPSNEETAALARANVLRGTLIEKGTAKRPGFEIESFFARVRGEDGRERTAWASAKEGPSALETALSEVAPGAFVELDGGATERRGRDGFARIWTAREVERDPAAVPARMKDRVREAVVEALGRPEIAAEILPPRARAAEAFADARRAIVGLDETLLDGGDERLTTRRLLADETGRARIAGVVVARDGDRVFVASSRLAFDRVVALSPSELSDGASAALAGAEIGSAIRLAERPDGRLETDGLEEWQKQVAIRRGIAASPVAAARKLLDFGEGSLEGVGFYAESKGLVLDASNGARTDGATPLLDLGDDLALCATPDGRAVLVESADLARSAREATSANPFELYDIARDARSRIKAAKDEREARPEAWGAALTPGEARARGVNESVAWKVIGEEQGRDGASWKLLRTRDGRELALRSSDLSAAGLRAPRGSSVRLGFGAKGLDASSCSKAPEAGLVR